MGEDRPDIGDYAELGRYVAKVLTGPDFEHFDEVLDSSDIADTFDALVEAQKLADEADYQEWDEYHQSESDIAERLQIAEAGWTCECAKVAALTTRAEAAEKRAESAEARAAAGGAALMEVAHAIERTRVATLQSAIEAIEARAVHRGAQVDVAQTHGGAWEVVAGKESELLAVADLLRARLRTGPEVATD
jgi:hypothetical protein